MEGMLTVFRGVGLLLDVGRMLSSSGANRALINIWLAFCNIRVLWCLFFGCCAQLILSFASLVFFLTWAELRDANCGSWDEKHKTLNFKRSYNFMLGCNACSQFIHLWSWINCLSFRPEVALSCANLSGCCLVDRLFFLSLSCSQNTVFCFCR